MSFVRIPVARPCWARRAHQSATGNEARIILADLEGPDGPFYSAVVNPTVRRRVYELGLSNNAGLLDVHPQLALQPRLLSGRALSADAGMDGHGVPSPRRSGAADMADPANAADAEETARRQADARTRVVTSRKTPRAGPGAGRGESVDAGAARVDYLTEGADREAGLGGDAWGREEDVRGASAGFDFAAAARQEQRVATGAGEEDEMGEAWETADSRFVGLSPGARRAAARRESREAVQRGRRRRDSGAGEGGADG
jgi:hypothetical protein